jgi:hypothetical protein
MMQNHTHCVYEWVRSDLGLPYYVGKGSRKRAYSLNRNKETNKVTEYLLDNGFKRHVNIIAWFLTHEAALDFERERIEFLWGFKEHGILTNDCKGGAGAYGHKHSENAKNKISKNNGMKNPDISIRFVGNNNPSKRPDVREKIKLSVKRYALLPENIKRMTGQNNPAKRDEVRLKLREGKIGNKNPMFGKPVSDETRKLKSEKNKAYYAKKRAEKAYLLVLDEGKI